jgi:transcription initiation factor IIE alpha subunit
MDTYSYRAMQTRELDVLLVDVVQQRLGSAAVLIVEALISRQALTLAALCKAVPSLAENAVRVQLASMMKHEVVAHDESTHLYSLSYGTGILPAFFPAIARFLADEYHQAAELVALVLFEYHDLPMDSIVRQTLRMQPDVELAVCKAIDSMRDDEILVSFGSTCSMMSSSAPGAGAHQTSERAIAARRLSGHKRTTDAADATSSLQFSWPVILARLRADRLRKFVADKYSYAAEKVLGGFLTLDSNQPSAGRTDRGFPKLHQSSSPLTAGAVQRRLAGVQPSAIVGAIEQFTSDARDAFLIPAATSASAADPAYSVSYVTVVRAMQRDIFEGIILSRHGIVGSRIVKLLAENEAMEDRFVAEEALITHTDARTTLAAMLREGFVKLLELPKGSIDDRVPKNSIFLWSINKEQVRETVQGYVVKSLCNMRARLQQELAIFRSAMPPSYFVDPTNTILSNDEAKLAAEHDVKRVALQHAVVSLLDRALVTLYF